MQVFVTDPQPILAGVWGLASRLWSGLWNSGPATLLLLGALAGFLLALVLVAASRLRDRSERSDETESSGSSAGTAWYLCA